MSKDRTIYEDVLTMFFLIRRDSRSGRCRKYSNLTLFFYFTSSRRHWKIPSQYILYPFSFYKRNAVVLQIWFYGCNMSNGRLFCCCSNKSLVSNIFDSDKYIVCAHSFDLGSTVFLSRTNLKFWCWSNFFLKLHYYFYFADSVYWCPRK